MRILLCLIVLLFSLSPVFACRPGEVVAGVNMETISVLASADFYDSLVQLKNIFEGRNKELMVYVFGKAGRELGFALREGGIKGRVDIVVTSAPEVFETFLVPDLSGWFVVFGKDELCLAFTERSRYADGVSAENWYKVIADPEVKLARPDENLDPLGYRTLMAWQLADLYYKAALADELLRRSVSGVYPSGEQLLSALQSGDIDYAFVYLSAARKRGLRYVQLPPEINLGSRQMASLYEQASVRVLGKDRGSIQTIKGKPIEYAAGFLTKSISKVRPGNFFKFLFSPESAAVFEKNGIAFGRPACTGILPEEFKNACCPKD